MIFTLAFGLRGEELQQGEWGEGEGEEEEEKKRTELTELGWPWRKHERRY